MLRHHFVLPFSEMARKAGYSPTLESFKLLFPWLFSPFAVVHIVPACRVRSRKSLAFKAFPQLQ